MITNKDIRVENGNLVLNGDKFPLDGQSPETIMEIVEDNSDTTPTENSTAPITSGGVYTSIGTVNTAIGAVDTKIGDLTQTGVTGADVAAQLAGLNTSKLTLVENKETTTGTTLTFDTTIQDKMYLIAMSSPFTTTSRQMKCSILRPVGTTTNEISFGNTNFEVTVNDAKLTITNSSILFGIRASLFILE